MNICVIAPDYPDSKRAVFPFVKNLVDKWGDIGLHVIVIAPFSVTHNRTIHHYKELPHSSNVEIRRPRTISVSNLNIFGLRVSTHTFRYSVSQELNSIKERPDVIYCHFWEQAVAAYNYAKNNNIPLVVASGESVIPNYLSKEPYRSMCNYVSKVVCVSTKNKNESVSLGLTTESKCRVFPNGIDNNLFRLSDQCDLKESLGIRNSDFVIAFVGWFIHRKGPLRVAQAIAMLNDDRIKSIFIGKGIEDPVCNGIVFKGVLQHDDISRYLNCADAFVLPTLAEGCCNAVIEAMACGLPVISSDLDFNWDVLNQANSIMVNPESVEDIAKAIAELRDNPDKRKRMSVAAIQTANRLTIDVRAHSIIDFMKRT